MILRRDSSPRRAEQTDPASIPDLARTLRQARLQRGLDLQEASEACGLSVTQLEDFEAGTVSRLPDRVAVLKGLRRYAEFLELLEPHGSPDPTGRSSVKGRQRAWFPGGGANLAEVPSTTLGRFPRASGGIGRRAGFRFLCPKGCGGSSPPSPTLPAARIAFLVVLGNRQPHRG